VTPILVSIGTAEDTMLLIEVIPHPSGPVAVGPVGICVTHEGRFHWVPIMALRVVRPNGDFPVGVGPWSLVENAVPEEAVR
jgi:hypothetical protein